MIDKFKGEHGYLSNFAYYGFHYGGNNRRTWYPSNEHFYQAMKTQIQSERVAIAAAPTATIAKKMASEKGYVMPDGTLFKIDLRNDWEQIKVGVMEYGLWQKFHHHPVIAEKLVATFPKRLIEGNWWHDNEWGNCTCGRPKCKAPGRNMLGKLLETLRFTLMLMKGGNS